MKGDLERKIDLGEKAEKDLGQNKKGHKTLKILFLIFLLLIVLVGVGSLLALQSLLEIKTDALRLYSQVSGVSESIQGQNLKGAIEKMSSAKQDISRLNNHYQRIGWAKFLPVLREYYLDGQRFINGGNYLLEAGEITVEALKPYADILGLEGGEVKKTEPMTTEKRLALALDTLDKIQPSFDRIGEKLELARKEVDQINPNRYPEKLRGKKIRENVVTLISAIDGTARIATEVKPIVGYFKPLLGIPNEKRYLLLFQNDAELRPTGGFITAYAVLSVNNGNFKPLGSFDIYSLDARFGNRLPPPQPIKEYHKNVFSWHMRDMNLSPDFKISMDTFMDNYSKVEGKGKIDGVIAIDTKFLVSLLKVLGPIGVGGWGNFSAENDPRCNCPKVFYELERLADKPVGTLRVERKAVIGPLMHSILLNVMQSPRKRWPEFFNLILNNVQEKHILFYFFDENVQKAIEALNAAGRIKDYQGDYLHVNDSNFAGAKSNMFIKETLTQEIEITSDGTINKLLTIDYRNPAPPSNCNLEAGELCLNGLYRDWVRIYVPKGSRLIEAKGSEVEVKTYEDLGKTVFEAFFGDRAPLRPLGKAQLTFKYQLPFKFEKGKPYRLLIQKQPGTYGYESVVKLGGKEEVFELKTDRELSL